LRILLLGPGGQLGSDLRAEAARDDSLEIVPVDREALDLSRPADIQGRLDGYRFDALVNCTAYNRTDDAEDHADLAFAINAHAVRELARAAAAAGADFVHVSTDYVFSGEGQSTPYQETDGTGPLNVYGASKRLGEALALAEAPEQTRVLRVASLFGVAGSSGKGGNFVETMLRLARETGRLRIVGDMRMSPTATSDIAKTILAMLRLQSPYGTWHVVNTGEASWCEFARAIVEAAGVPAAVVPVPHTAYPTKARRPLYSVLDTGKLAAAIGALPPWEDALERYIDAKGHRR
jgi:dTDP-4-dehydrorhamnose reductase